jgi:hypothetical protein
MDAFIQILFPSISLNGIVKESIVSLQWNNSQNFGIQFLFRASMQLTQRTECKRQNYKQNFIRSGHRRHIVRYSFLTQGLLWS